LPKTLATSEVTPSRRQAHKMRTERLLQQAALELFAKQGYDETTTEAIAEKAGVSPRTFFRYFSTKESVLFLGEDNWFRSFTADFERQPGELSDIEAMRDTLIGRASGIQKGRRSQMLYEKAVASSATLRGGVHDRQQHDIATVADAVANRRGLHKPDESCLLLSAIGLMTHRRALTAWIEGPASGDLGATIAEHFAVLEGLLASPDHTRRRS